MGNGIVSPRGITITPNQTAANATIIAAAQTLGGAGNLTLAGTAATFGPDGVAFLVTLTGTGGTDMSGVNFTISGTDANGGQITAEILAGPNGVGPVTSTQYFNTVTQIAVSAGTGANVSAGHAGGAGGESRVVFAGRTRVRGIFGTTAATANSITSISDGNQTDGTEIFAIRNPLAAQTFINPADAPGGLLVKDNLQVILTANSFLSLTLYYDG